jgi:hypothetical protein
MRMRLTYLLILALALFVMSVRANLSFTLAPAVLPGTGSNEVVFVGTLTNNSLTNLYLNNVQFTFTNAATNHLTGDTNFFFQNIPGILSSNGTYSDVVMGVLVRSSTPVGTYSGAASIQGGGDEFGTNDLADASFQISLSPPVLGITTTTTNLELAWPAPPGGFIVLQNSNLMTANWTTNTFPIFTNQTTESVSIMPTNGNLFFRLSQQ